MAPALTGSLRLAPPRPSRNAESADGATARCTSWAISPLRFGTKRRRQIATLANHKDTKATKFSDWILRVLRGLRAPRVQKSLQFLLLATSVKGKIMRLATI